MTELESAVHYTTTIGSGKHWSLRLRRGLSLQLTDLLGGANVAMVLYNTNNLLERYNAPDTLKCQHTFHLTQGHCLYSDMGHVMASVTKDTANGHETICGNSTSEIVAEQYGSRSYQQDRNDWRQNGTDAFLVELSKYGLNRADLPANVNWFNRCRIEEEGSISLANTHVEAGRTVQLRIDMDCLVLLHTCPHPLSSSGAYPEMRVEISLSDAAPMKDDDECLNSCDENRRGFENNRIYHLGSVQA
ncbi:MAG: urea amidolyase associated protein UAAP1 [Granulosicoccus sp.]